MNKNEEQTVTVLTKKSAALLGNYQDLTIESDDQLQYASDELGEVKKLSKELDATKKSITQPLNAALKEIRALFAVPESNLKEAETVLKHGILQYHELKDTAAQAEIEKIENRIKPGKGNLSITSGMQRLADVDQAETNLGGAQVRLGAEKVRITDALALIQDHPSILISERVLEALRIELAAEIKMGGRVPAGAELYREKLVAGIAA